MSFFGNNNTQQSSGFGSASGFGSNNNTNTGGFGQSNNTNTGGFGQATASTTPAFGGGFGSGTGGFGSNNTGASLFGQNKPAFGASNTNTGGGLFGGGAPTTTNNSGFGGFGNNAATTNNTATTGGLFGSQSKPAFGAPASTGGGLFGSSNTASSGAFGSNNNNTTSTFGSPFGQQPKNDNCEGTGSVPFQAWTEKEGASSTTNHFQSVTFMAPYKNFSLEELRIADYNQGRRYGNANGQAGAFGSTAFGGFGQQQNNTGGFGQSNNNQSGGLLGATNTTSGFGAATNTNTGGGLFGQSKPGGLFGNASSTTSNSGGVFGANNTTTNTGFGSNSTSGAFGSGGGGLFGQAQNSNQQAKPFSLGATTAPTTGGFGTTGTGFGANSTNTGGGLFGSGNTNNTTPFGQTTNNTNTSNAPSGGLFGNSNLGQNAQNTAQPAAANPFGGFGQPAQEQKSTGLFGNTSATTNTGGLFGNQSSNQTTGGLFGQTNNTQAAGTSLFGAPKPATTGGLFGQATANANTTSGLFGNSTAQPQAQTGGLFGNNTNDQKPGGLFGNNTTNTGGGLFGNANVSNNNQQQQGSSLFGLGANNNQQQTGGGLFGNANNAGSSLFGNSQQTQQQAAPQNQFQAAQMLQTSINDPNAFGSPSIFSGLPPPPQVSGPIATPISQKVRPNKSAILPYYKLTPSGSTRYQTPQRTGYGLSYSVNGTPGSTASNISTPGAFGASFLSNSMMRGSLNRGLGKSLSTSNLRSGLGESDSVLSPGAFSAGNSRFGSASSMKKLTIDRSLRTDLFGARSKPSQLALPSPEKDKDKQAGILKKKVSFDTHAHAQGAPIDDKVISDEGTNSTNPGNAQQGSLNDRTISHSAMTKTPSHTSQAESDVVRGNELAIVPEDGSPTQHESPAKSAVAVSLADPKPGQYWMSPSKEEIQKMSREEKQELSGFSVGREGCGKVEFDEPVDISNININDIFDNIVVITIRNLTVYPETHRKPAQGRGLNVPSIISLENSWPRAKDRRTPALERSGPRYNKHIERLKKVTGTEFVRYERDTGTWVFRVPHFTTYGLDYDEDDAAAGMADTENVGIADRFMSDMPVTPTPPAHDTRSNAMSTILPNVTSKEPFATRNHAVSPQVQESVIHRKRKCFPGSFDFGGSISDDDMDYVSESPASSKPKHDSFLDGRLAASVSYSSNDEEEPSDLPDADHLDLNSLKQKADIVHDEADDLDIEMIGSFPEQLDLVQYKIDPIDKIHNMADDWSRELERTLNTRRQDRLMLRQRQENRSSVGSIDHNKEIEPQTASIMDRSTPIIATSIDLMNSLFGQSRPEVLKPTKAKPSSHSVKLNQDTPRVECERGWDNLTQAASADIPKANSSLHYETIPTAFQQQRSATTYHVNEQVPAARPASPSFREYKNALKDSDSYESSIWELAAVLFDAESGTDASIPAAEQAQFEARVRKDVLIRFWQRICQSDADEAIDQAKTPEERVFALLSVNRVTEACEVLIESSNYRLASLVAQIGGDSVIHHEITSQIQAWRNLNVLSEISEPVRALYSLLSGEVCRCEGKESLHAEDRAASFGISERFQLDWKRAFGLRLYYAIQANDPIDEAVVRYLNEVEAGTESSRPGHDIYYYLLQLFAASKDRAPVPAISEAIVAEPALDTRSGFQLCHLLRARLAEIYSEDATAPVTDSLTVILANQLDAVNEWQWGVFVLLHIIDPTKRSDCLKAFLAHRAREIKADPPRDTTWSLLVDKMQIPAAWVWEAKASSARAIDHDRIRETTYLVRAGQWTAAHKVLKHVVGPDCVIAEDWAQLRGVLDSFRAGRDKLVEWGLGGQIFEDYLQLVMQGPGVNTAEIASRLSESLASNLHNLQQNRDAAMGIDTDTMASADAGTTFRELVAIKEMIRFLGVQGADMTVDATVSERVNASLADAALSRVVGLRTRFYQQ